jgi:hypothetical protein
MNDELKNEVAAAAERLRRLTQFGGTEECEAVYSGHDAWKPVEDAEKLAIAYLATHPADSDEPIDEGWLRSVGFANCLNDYFIRSPMSTYGASVIVKIKDHSIGVVIVDSGNNQNYPTGSAAVGKNWTRGQLRDLMRVLNIQTKEPQ